MAAGRELKTGQAAVGRDVLVLLADGLAEPIDLDQARLLGQLARVDEVLLVRVQRLEQRCFTRLVFPHETRYFAERELFGVLDTTEILHTHFYQSHSAP